MNMGTNIKSIIQKKTNLFRTKLLNKIITVSSSDLANVIFCLRSQPWIRNNSVSGNLKFDKQFISQINIKKVKGSKK